MTKAPKMTKAHFKYLAGMMTTIRPNHKYDRIEYMNWAYTVRSMATALTWTNDNFDKNAFISACEGE